MKNLDTLQNEYAGGKITFNEYIQGINQTAKNDAVKLSNAFYRLNKMSLLKKASGKTE